MMTKRQQAILSAIVEEYAEVASPVGSVMLAKLFGVSSATIRSEMSRLEEMGYIAQPHTSAGRIPTDKGYRFYVNGVVESDSEPDAKSRSNQVMNTRIMHAGQPAQTIRSAVDSLAEITHNLGLATIGDQLYISGLSRLFMQPEFSSGGPVHEIARLLDNLEPWLREAAPNQALNVYIGHENPIGKNAGASLIISRFNSPYSDHSYIGVLGPTRQSYARVMNLVQHTGELLESIF
jgi:heat-inducible transcriptional repressor